MSSRHRKSLVCVMTGIMCDLAQPQSCLIWVKQCIACWLGSGHTSLAVVKACLWTKFPRLGKQCSRRLFLTTFSSIFFHLSACLQVQMRTSLPCTWEWLNHFATSSAPHEASYYRLPHYILPSRVLELGVSGFYSLLYETHFSIC